MDYYLLQTNIKTPAVNFINVKCARLLYERHFGSFFLVTCKKASETTFVQKFVSLTLMKLTPELQSLTDSTSP